MTKKQSFSQKIQSANPMLIQLVRSHDEKGRPVYAYIALTEHSAKKLARDLEKNAPLDLESYGDIIASGFGHEPSLFVQQRIQQQFGEP